MYGISYLWSDDKNSWGYHYTVKAPILLLPLAFALLPAFTAKQLRIFTIAGCIIFLAVAAYSLHFFLEKPNYYAEQYVYSHIFPTLPDNDHIRHSLAISLFIVWCVYVWAWLHTNWQRWLVGATVLVLSIYLHILAARTGLVVWYLFVLLWTVRYAMKKSFIAGISFLAVLAIGSFIAVKNIPTLEKKIWYVTHSMQLYKQGSMQSGYSDIGRLISYKVAGSIIAANPATGVGGGDMYAEMQKGYDAAYKDVPQEYRLLPHNQFFIVMLATGIVGLVLFVAWVLMPLSWLKNGKRTFYLFVTWFALALTLLIEPMFEVQYGVFVYLFFLLWQQHAIRTQENTV
jgi:O-antigen ligase